VRGAVSGRIRVAVCGAIAVAALGLTAPSAVAAGHDLAGGQAAFGRSASSYWTPARMRAAESLDAVTRPAPTVSPGRALSRSLSPTPRSSSGHRFDAARSIAPQAPTAEPLARGRGRIQAPPFISGEVPTSSYGTFPIPTNGRLFFTLSGGDYACSATSVASSSDSVVLTAGHCVHDKKLGWARNVVFVPVYREGLAPYGAWTGTFETAPRGWVRNEDFASDFAAIKFAASAYGPLGAFVGEEGIAWGQSRRQLFQAIGYPGNFAHGEVMWTCVSSSAGKDPFSRGPGAADTGIGCDMGHGSSGGSWTIRNSDGVPFVNSVTSYGYDRLPNLLFGSYFTRKVPALVRRASRG
jgi:hypothetical protein